MFTENLAQFFEQTDFAVPAVFKRGAATLVTTDVILDTPTHAVGVYETDIEEAACYLRVRTALIADVRRRDTVLVNAVTYRIERLEEDGTGVTRVHLAEVV